MTIDTFVDVNDKNELIEIKLIKIGDDLYRINREGEIIYKSNNRMLAELMFKKLRDKVI